jgi:hypothetical protein
MRKQTIEYSSPVDALVEVAKRLSVHEMEEKMESEEFFHLFCQGQMSDNSQHVEWANDYRHYLSLRQDLEDKLKHAA